MDHADSDLALTIWHIAKSNRLRRLKPLPLRLLVVMLSRCDPVTGDVWATAADIIQDACGGRNGRHYAGFRDLVMAGIIDVSRDGRRNRYRLLRPQPEHVPRKGSQRGRNPVAELTKMAWEVWDRSPDPSIDVEHAVLDAISRTSLEEVKALLDVAAELADDDYGVAVDLRSALRSPKRARRILSTVQESEDHEEAWQPRSQPGRRRLRAPVATGGSLPRRRLRAQHGRT